MVCRNISGPVNDHANASRQYLFTDDMVDRRRQITVQFFGVLILLWPRIDGGSQNAIHKRSFLVISFRNTEESWTVLWDVRNKDCNND